MSHQLPYPSNTPINPSGYVSPPQNATPAGQYSMGTVSSPPPPPPPPKSDSFPLQQGHAGTGQSYPPRHSSFPPTSTQTHAQQQAGPPAPVGPLPPAPEEQWLPRVLQDKSKTDLETILSDPALLTSLLHAPSTTHPSLPASQKPLQDQLDSNVQLASQLLSLESQIQNLRSSLTPSLLRVSALERQFRAKQEAMDDALAPWAPKAVHTRLGQGVQEQEAWCRAMEESFLDGAEGADGGVASDREVSEWLGKYREGRKVLELRKEKKLRLEEGRVSGWK